MCYGKKSIKYDPHYKFCRCNEIMMQHHTYLLTSPLRYQSAATCPAPMLSSLPLMIHRVIATRQATDSSNARFIGFLPLLNKEQSKPRYHRFSSSPRRVPKVKCIRHMSSFEKPRHQPMSRSCTACSHSRESNFRVHAIWNSDWVSDEWGDFFREKVWSFLSPKFECFIHRGNSLRKRAGKATGEKLQLDEKVAWYDFEQLRWARVACRALSQRKTFSHLSPDKTKNRASFL